MPLACINVYGALRRVFKLALAKAKPSNKSNMLNIVVFLGVVVLFFFFVSNFFLKKLQI